MDGCRVGSAHRPWPPTAISPEDYPPQCTLAIINKLLKINGLTIRSLHVAEGSRRDELRTLHYPYLEIQESCSIAIRANVSPNQAGRKKASRVLPGSRKVME